MGSWKRLRCGTIVPEILSIIKRTRQLSLMLGQKMELLLSYIFPRYIHSLLIHPPCEGALKLLDSEVRQKVKGILHLTPSTAFGFFYTPKTNGGLGLPRFEHIAKLCTLKNAIKMKNSLDPVASSLIDDRAEQKLKKIANSLRINWPTTSEDVEKARNGLKKEHIRQWAELRGQGQRVANFAKEKLGDVWLTEYHLLKPSRFIDAIRMRTNTFGTRRNNSV